ncbi:MAG: AraC family transcriptional regulator [Calditrichaeota bacterium]|nr:MAG: AraC family transcriptional regulator [Calditrichota bacterium]MBL1207040.1 AraC family transcriptional regulator [Calditrichota bacterium]NOG46868.1 helix-turn-helix transcriptional regulator [Calditrichota bacterium]
MQKYIDSHINKPITLYNLAQTCGFSPWHASRVFKELIGKSPFEYIRALRITKAALKLRDEDVKVIDVAFDFVFDTHEGFTRAFSNQFGINPITYKKQTPPLKLFIPFQIEDTYRYKQKEEREMHKDRSKKSNNATRTVFVQVVERPPRKVILKRGIKAKDYFEYCEEVGCDVWGVLISIKEALYEPVGLWLPPNLITENTSQYAQGIEVPIDYSGQIPDGFDSFDLKPCKIMIFQGQPFKDEDFEDAISDLWEVMKTYNPEIYGFKWADQDAPRFQMEPQGYRGYIEGRPVTVAGKR